MRNREQLQARSAELENELERVRGQGATLTGGQLEVFADTLHDLEARWDEIALALALMVRFHSPQVLKVTMLGRCHFLASQISTRSAFEANPEIVHAYEEWLWILDAAAPQRIVYGDLA